MRSDGLWPNPLHIADPLVAITEKYFNQNGSKNGQVKLNNNVTMKIKIKEILRSKTKFIIVIAFLFLNQVGFSQEKSFDCVELLKEKSATLIAKDYSHKQEDEIVEEIIECPNFSIHQEELENILGEPDQI